MSRRGKKGSKHGEQNISRYLVRSSVSENFNSGDPQHKENMAAENGDYNGINRVQHSSELGEKASQQPGQGSNTKEEKSLEKRILKALNSMEDTLESPE